MSVKEQLYNQCQSYLDERLKVIQHKISEIQESLQSETKSSAGDKHETGRAMLQLEREKAGQQLAEVQKLQETLYKVNLKSHNKTTTLGSVIYTSQHNYFIAISAGKMNVNNEVFYAISANTPIAKLLLGKAKNESICFRNSNFVITEIL